jgi:cysteine desulfurase / selenocysteine lyase
MDWVTLRDEFPVTRRWMFFDHAAVAPLTARARKVMDEWSNDTAENGAIHEREWLQRVEKVRELAANLIQADPLEIAFIKNTCEGIGFVAEGFPWKAGDNMVTAAEEYPANIYPWMNLSDRGVEVRRIPSRGNRLEVDDLRAAMDARTRLVSLSTVEFSSGFRNDLTAIGSLCRERGIYFFADAIQSLGVIPLDVRQMPVDFLAADSHKWMLGPQGAGIFFIRRELVDLLHAVGIGWNSVQGARDFSRIDFRLKPHAGRWESGTLNMAGIIGMGGSLELLAQIGIAKIWERIQEHTDYLCEQSERKGLGVFSSRWPEDKSGIVSLVVPGAEPRSVVRRCRDARVIINQRAGRVRVSPHCYNSREEIDHLLELLQGCNDGKPS